MKEDAYLTTHPPRVAGFLIQLCVILTAGIGIVAMVRLAMVASQGVTSLVYFVIALLLFLPIPLLVYRISALLRAEYTISRDGIQLQWGMRQETLSIDDVDWIKIDREGKTQLNLPRFYWPGSILGVQPDEEFGEIEYLASSPNNLVLIKSRGKCYVISPPDAAQFIAVYQKALELGSLTPLLSRSVSPSFPLAKAWEIRPARYILLVGLFLNVALLVWVSLVVPQHETISLNFESPGLPAQEVPSGQLYLLPFIGLFFYVFDFILGWIYYRREGGRLAAYILWTGSVVTPLLLVMAYIFILLNL
jgi:hypothetical protein